MITRDNMASIAENPATCAYQSHAFPGKPTGQFQERRSYPLNQTHLGIICQPSAADSIMLKYDYSTEYSHSGSNRYQLHQPLYYYYGRATELIDSVRLDIKAGNGGNGCASFLREKYKPHGGPDGGDGGHGGNALLQGDSSYNTLLHLRFTSTIYVDRGAHGRGKDRKGKNGEDEVLKVPLGTQVFRREPDGSRTLLADICDDTPVLVAQGGLGGWGNARYVSATNQEPVLAQRGGAGERVTLFLELKLLADVALVARPNAGKSSLVSRTTGASPRIADYPFTHGGTCAWCGVYQG